MSELESVVETVSVETSVEVVKPVDLYAELDQQSFSFLLKIRDYLTDLLSKKALEEKAALVEKSVELSGYFGTDVNALLNDKGKDSKKRARGKVKETEPKIKYRDDNGNTWTGKGPKPNWFKAALEAGVDPETFRVG